jgi:FG-GAP-like repeat
VNRKMRNCALMILAASCTAVGCTDGDADALGSTEQALYYDDDEVWGKTSISVCWADFAQSTVTARDWVRMAVENAFETATIIDFTGWNQCSFWGGDDLVIYVGEREWPRAELGGDAIYFNFFGTFARDLDNDDNDNNPSTGRDFEECYANSGTVTGLTGKTWSSPRRHCIDIIAVHEFAHSIGIAHEQNRSDTPAFCTEDDDGYGDTSFGYWDITSISNYCNPAWNNDGELSVLDVAGIEMLYGTSVNDHLWWGIGNVKDWGNSSANRLAFTVREHSVADATYAPFAGDFNGDGRDDIFWYAAGAHSDYIWFFNADGSHTSQTLQVTGKHVPVVADFNGDGRDDVFWYTVGTSSDYIWFFNADGSHWSRTEQVTESYTALAGDFNGDGRGDIFWYGAGAASDSVWTFNGDGTHDAEAYWDPSLDPFYAPVAGDFDGNGLTDIIWRRQTGNAPIWYFDGFLGVTTHEAIGGYFGPDPSYTVVKSGDFNGDGRDDLLAFKPGSTGDEIRLMTSTKGVDIATATRKDGDGTPIMGDFNGDGLADIFWYR